MIKTTNAPISGWPDFDFRSLPLNPLSRKQLAGIYDHVRASGSVPPHRSKLLTGVIIPAIFVPERGLYLPASDNMRLFRKLRVYRDRFDASFATFPRGPIAVAFFGNALLIPPGYGTASFRHRDAAMPALRVTNAGFLAVTLEIDCKTRDDLEQNLAWTRGRSGDFGKSAFAQVDAKLCRFEDYRGYTIVFSGNRSLHFHFLFSTAHLEHCPAGAAAAARFGENQPRQSALMCNAHTVYWDGVAEIFHETLGPSLQADRKLRSVTQWRRTPWALRRLEKDSDILNLPMGTIVPQLVLHENIRTRASGSARDFLVPRTFSLADPIKRAPRASAGRRPFDFEVTPMIRELQDMCAAEWGPYPRPVSIALQGDEWLIKFKNHEHDRTPSTLGLGGYRRLQLNGEHAFTQAFYLPEGMAAQDLGDLLALRFGASPSPSAAGGESLSGESSSKESLHSGGPLHLECSRAWARGFREPISENANGLRKRYRDKFGQILVQATAFDREPMLLTSGEGIGKSTAFLRILAASAFDRALARRQASATRKFVAFAFRSRKQAEEKAEDFRQHGVSTMAVKTFWDHLAEACRDAGIPQLGRDDFDEHTASHVLGELASQQPGVFDLLEARRSQLWSRARFDDATTVLVMTHKAAEHWQTGRITRAWHHPEFDPFGDPLRHETLASRIRLADVVFDDPEALDFVHLLPEALYVFVKNKQAQHHGWRNFKRPKRREVFDALKADIPGTQIDSFEDFDELMRLDLERLRPYAVDYETIPFGRDNPNANGIYRPRNGDRYFLGVKRWLFEMQARPIFLTTETLVANAIEKAIGEVFADVIKRPSPAERNDEDVIETENRDWRRRSLFRLALDDVPGVYPIHVPLFLDARARADRDGIRYVSALAAEIAAADPDAAIISDGVSGVPNVYTFQSMKGLNGLERKNLHIILTWLAPDTYAELNILGQWLGCGRVIEQHYQDQINQAAGRNRGFRQAEAPAKTVVFASMALWSGFLRRLEVGAPRTRLFLTTDQSWKGQDLAAEAETAS